MHGEGHATEEVEDAGLAMGLEASVSKTWLSLSMVYAELKAPQAPARASAVAAAMLSGEASALEEEGSARLLGAEAEEEHAGVSTRSRWLTYRRWGGGASRTWGRRWHGPLSVSGKSRRL